MTGPQRGHAPPPPPFIPSNPVAGDHTLRDKPVISGLVWRLTPETTEQNTKHERLQNIAMNDSIGLYLNDIGKVPLLTAEDERVLSRAIEKGRESAERIAAGEKSRQLKKDLNEAAAAKDRFIRSNLRLVVSIARRYPLPQGMDLLDLIQEGNLGLEHAVDKFDWRRGFKFSTYATFWIRQAIGRALDQKASLIRIPGDRSASLRAALRQASGDGETLDLSNAELHRLTTPVSLDKTIGDDGDATLGDLMDNGQGTPEDAVMALVDSELLNELLGTLDDRARFAVEARFGLLDGERKSFREVGEHLGVTAEAARRLVSRAVAGLREDAERILAA
jgi:RNA polymerase primary sigma factor